jgi:hypothetical protein
MPTAKKNGQAASQPTKRGTARKVAALEHDDDVVCTSVTYGKPATSSKQGTAAAVGAPSSKSTTLGRPAGQAAGSSRPVDRAANSGGNRNLADAST